MKNLQIITLFPTFPNKGQNGFANAPMLNMMKNPEKITFFELKTEYQIPNYIP